MVLTTLATTLTTTLTTTTTTQALRLLRQMPIVRLYHPHHQDGDDDCKVASAMVMKKRIVAATAKIMTKTTEIIMTMGGLLRSKRMYSQHMSVCIMGAHSDLLVRVLANRLNGV